MNLALLAPRVRPPAAVPGCRDPQGHPASLVLAVGMEAARLLPPMRGSNVDDVLLNVPRRARGDGLLRPSTFASVGP